MNIAGNHDTGYMKEFLSPSCIYSGSLFFHQIIGLLVPNWKVQAPPLELYSIALLQVGFWWTFIISAPLTICSYQNFPWQIGTFSGVISNLLCNTQYMVLWKEPSCTWCFGEHSKVHFATAVDTGWVELYQMGSSAVLVMIIQVLDMVIQKGLIS